MELERLDATLQTLRQEPGVEVFALSEAMLERAVTLSLLGLDLKPFDQAILAAVLVRAEELFGAGEQELAFCEIDSDLQPWDKNGNPKQPLTRLYDAARVWVYGDFALGYPSRPEGWPEPHA